MVELRRLHPCAPFDFVHTLAALADFPGSRVRREVDQAAGSLTQAWRIGPTCHVVTIRSTGTTLSPALTIEATAALPDRDVDRLERTVRRALSLDADLSPLEAAADPAFEPVLRALYGYHPPRFPSPFEAACWTLVRQRTPMSYATATMERLVATLGSTSIVAGQTHTCFPVPTEVDASTRPALLGATNNVRKVERLVATAAAFATLDPEELEHAPYEEVFRELMQIHGLGRWSVEFVMLRGLGRYERTPWSDTGALAAISRVYVPGFTLARGSARELAERYRGLQGLWLTYLKRYVFTLGLA